MQEAASKITHMAENDIITSEKFGRLPPQAPDVERAIVGCCLIEQEAFSRVSAIIPSGDCFYVDAHQKIYKAILSLNKTGYPIDLLTVAEELRKAGELERIGGERYLAQLSDTITSTAHVETHSYMVMEKYFARELIRVSGKAFSAGFEDATDIFDLLDQTKSEIEAITKDIGGAGDAPIGKLFLNMLQEIEYQKNNRTALTGLDTGLFDLNEITNGWQKSDLIIIGARPSKGKTALALNLALSAAISTLVASVPVGIFSLEMGATQLVKRMSSTVTGIDFGKIISGNLTDPEFVTVSQKSKYFNALPIRIADRVYTLLKIEAQAKKWKDKHNIGLIIIDYLQLIKGERQSGANREQEISNISRRLKLLAKDLDVPIILLSQLNRSVESRSGSPEPMPSDLRESGAIEQDADVIIFPWHSNENKSYISVAKNRNGKTAVKENAIEIVFSGSIQKWMDKSAFEPFREMTERDNPRAGIRNYYEPDKKPFIDEEAPF